MHSTGTKKEQTLTSFENSIQKNLLGTQAETTTTHKNETET
jgi:hypothetical protein